MESHDRPKVRVQDNIVYGLPGAKVPNTSVGQYVFDNLRANADSILQVDVETGQHYTCQDILEKSVKISSILKSYGINIEDRVTVTAENHPNIVAAMCGIFHVGAALAPLNPAYTEREYRHMLKVLKPRVIFVSRRTEELLVKIVPTLSWTVKLIELDDKAVTIHVPTLKDLLKEHDHVNSSQFLPTMIGDSSKRMAAILCSSGTTGVPKGVALSHRNILTFVRNSNDPRYLTIEPNSRILVYLPLFHGYAVGVVMIAASVGATMYTMKSFDIENALKLIEKYRITYLPLVPPILVLLAKHPGLAGYDLSSVRKVVCGAAPFPKDVAEEVKRRLKIDHIKNGYGMTELSVLSHICDEWAGDDSVGNLLPGFLCKVTDRNTGESLGPGQIGEICVKGDQVMLGYFGDPKNTGETIDKDDWLHTGDLGYHDEKGRLYVTGRVKELIKYKGFQVSPSEIESLLLSHSEVKDVAVTGKPDEISGELPTALIVQQPGSNVTAEEIVEFVKRNLSPQKWLRGGVKFVAAIPKNPSGKILRRELINLVQSKM